MNKKPTLDTLSSPPLTLKVPPSGMGTTQHSPVHQHQMAMSGMSGTPNAMHPMNQQQQMHNMMNMSQMSGSHMFMPNMQSMQNMSNMRTPTGMNMNMSFPNMPMPMPNFQNDNAGEYQKYILMMMNYYEGHLGNMKTMVVQQNEVINQEKHKNQVLEHRNAELVKKIQELDASIKGIYFFIKKS